MQGIVTNIFIEWIDRKETGRKSQANGSSVEKRKSYHSYA